MGVRFIFKKADAECGEAAKRGEGGRKSTEVGAGGGKHFI